MTTFVRLHERIDREAVDVWINVDQIVRIDKGAVVLTRGPIVLPIEDVDEVMAILQMATVVDVP